MPSNRVCVFIIYIFLKTAFPGIKEIEIADYEFDGNEKYIDAVGSLDSLEKATIQCDIYCIGVSTLVVTVTGFKGFLNFSFWKVSNLNVMKWL